MTQQQQQYPAFATPPSTNHQQQQQQQQQQYHSPMNQQQQQQQNTPSSYHYQNQHAQHYPSGGMMMSSSSSTDNNAQHQQQQQQPRPRSTTMENVSVGIVPTTGTSSGGGNGSMKKNNGGGGSSDNVGTMSSSHSNIGGKKSRGKLISSSSNKKKKKKKSGYYYRHNIEDDVLVTYGIQDEETEDGRIRNREAMKKIRDTWIYKQIRNRQDEFTEYHNAILFVGTWNVNAKTVGGDSEQASALNDWLYADVRKGYGMPDIVCIGFQEIVDLNAVNVAVDNKTQQKSQFWTERLLQALNDTNNHPQQQQQQPPIQYALVQAKSMVGLLICIYVQLRHVQRVRYIHSNSVGVGVMGMMGNKGGVSIRLQFYDTTLCFICSHLAAHRENIIGRNADFHNVYNKCTFDIGDTAIREVIRSGSLSHIAVNNNSNSNLMTPNHNTGGPGGGGGGPGVGPGGTPGGGGPGGGASSSMSSSIPHTSTIGIHDHDMVFWLGDLNYRIDESIQTERVLQMAEKGASILLSSSNPSQQQQQSSSSSSSSTNNPTLLELAKYDQLNMERNDGRVFDDFYEGDISQFPPTYKYQPNTDIYEQRPDKKLRAPAWCDRILYMCPQQQQQTMIMISQQQQQQQSNENQQHTTTQNQPNTMNIHNYIQQCTYNRSIRPNISDHKAVYSTFQLKIKDVIHTRREHIYTELMSLLDKYENSTLPSLGLDRVALDFGHIRYEQSITMSINIANTGSVIAQYRFVPKPDERNICKSFIEISPTYGMLIPGDPVSKIDFTISIDNRIAKLLNNGHEILDDILILRLENGRDYYITIKATYARSCFGMSVDELVLYTEPIRNIPLDPIQRSILQQQKKKQQQTQQHGGDASGQQQQRSSSSQPAALCVPKELWRLVDAIYEKGGLYEPNIFVSSTSIANQYEVECIRESLDKNDVFNNEFNVHSYAEVLIQFLSNLSIPIIPNRLFPVVDIDSTNIQALSRKLLEELTPIHYNVFVYLISFFRELLLYRQQNQIVPAQIARICTQCITSTTTTQETYDGTGAGNNMMNGGGDHHHDPMMTMMDDHYDYGSGNGGHSGGGNTGTGSAGGSGGNGGGGSGTHHHGGEGGTITNPSSGSGGNSGSSSASLLQRRMGMQLIILHLLETSSI